MFCRSIGWFICVFVAAAMASGYSDPDSITESSTKEPVPEVRDIADADLGALLDASDGAMVTLVAGDTRLVAHRAVLAARSPVFAALPRHNVLDSRNTLVTIPDVEGPVLRQMVAYMYTLQVPQLPSMAAKLLVAADKYGLPALEAACEQQVAAQLSVENAAATAVLAVRNSYTSLRQSAVAFIKAHIFHVVDTQGWADAMHRQPEDLTRVIQLMSEPPVQTSPPPTADSRRAAPATRRPHRDRSRRRRTRATVAPPTAAARTSTHVYTSASPPRSSDPYFKKMYRRFYPTF